MITQANRLLSIETPHAFDTLLIGGVRGVESLSRPFQYHVQLLADVASGRHTQVDPEQLIGNAVTVAVHLLDDEQRYIHGIVKNFTVGGQDERFVHYRADLVPWFDLLKMSSNCRFFQKQTVPEIVEQVFKDLGFRAYRLNLRGTYTQIDYCAQYRETDFDFVSRLLEQEGIFYYFEHTADEHTMILADAPSAYLELPHKPLARSTRFGSLAEEEDIITDWEETRELQSSKWKMRDYHFELQRKSLEVERDAITQRETAKHLVMYDYPGAYAKKFNNTSERLGSVQTEGDDRMNRVQMESDEAHVTVIEGESDCRAFIAGYKLKVAGDDPGQVIGEYLLRSVAIDATQAPGYFTDDTVEHPYKNQFTCIPADTRFRPPITTVKPIVSGPQSAWVVDESNKEPSKEEIWPDKFGRVRVRFQWDIESKYACWLRVAQPWAGRGWGHQWVPRTGDEVLVDFVDGDPDCPIVIGSLYNTDNMPPFKLPDYKTQSGIVTRTTTKGTTHQFNMLRFDDKKSKEQVMIRSQRRADVRAYGSFYETNHANRHIVVGWEGHTEEESGGDFNITIQGEHNVHVKKGVYTEYDKKLARCVKEDAVYDYEKNRTTKVTTKDQLAAQQIILEGTQKISLKVGSSCIVIEPTGITIAATQVKINSGGFGVEVTDPGIDCPVDATLSDNGEPGYLDQKSGHAGPYHGHTHRALGVQHYVGPPRATDPPAFAAVRATMATTPAGRHALEVIDRNNVAVTMTPGAATVYSESTNPPGGTIQLDPAATDPAGSTVHEAGHAEAHNEHRDADTQTQSRADYIDTQLREDAHNERMAYENEQQLADNGTPEPYNSSTSGRYHSAYTADETAYRAAHPDASEAEVRQHANDAAEAAILQDYRNGTINTGNTTPPQSYVNYWGNAYDTTPGAGSRIPPH